MAQSYCHSSQVVLQSAGVVTATVGVATAKIPENATRLQENAFAHLAHTAKIATNVSTWILRSGRLFQIEYAG